MATATDQAERMAKARTLLVLDHPFFGALALRLNTAPEPGVGTMATDGKNIRYDPKWVATLDDHELRGVLAHEVMHCAQGHVWRRGGRDMHRWNVACDLAINPIITEAGLRLPQGAMLPDPGQAGKAAEEIYAGLPQMPNGGKGKGKGVPDPGGCGAVEDGAANPGEARAEAAEWKVAVSQAAQAARMAGKLPASLARLVNEIVNPAVPWATLLRDFVERSARNDYAWSRPNTRHLGRGIVLPGLVSEELPAVVVAVDTSGSIGQAELATFAAEASGVLEAYQTTIELVYCDAEVAGHRTITREDLPLQLEPKGGGGTDFRPVFAWVAEQGLTPACLIYLTDMYGSFPDDEPEYPVLWISTTNIEKAPFGEVVRLRVGE